MMDIDERLDYSSEYTLTDEDYTSLDRLGIAIEESQEVQKMVESKGWEKVIGPMLEQMVFRVTGGFSKDGSYVKGLFDEREVSDTKLKCLHYYKHALIDFMTNIVSYQSRLADLTMKYKEILSKQGDPTFIDNESRYVPEETDDSIV